ncbi:LutB/LldF family L-lactate oxidation iron-sulfur protein [Promineifilum sp.]|uniref:LutB/LldF family L-lactate oxidation iron-sulfur protein n=1 Tax=Promineifilum sp. TaxID=2664178 RepID=UPI0035ADA0ED
MSLTAPNVSFFERVEDALGNDFQRRAFDRASTRFTTLRRDALAALPEAEAIRDRARLIRAHTISRLDSYLEQFAAAVEAAGGHVHWAEDAEAASRYVVEIAQAAGVRLAVKSKSMVTEEIHLNRALETAGVRVVESDLGEYIIQLAGETPSHIITPVIHKTKEECGAILHEKTGAPLTDEPAEMTAAVREQMRRIFLSAGMGISGVNFGVAETGAICLVTNEGNGRMTTTLPRVHVAVMGIERLVPTLADLGVMLQVLARSATGQQLTVYTNLVTGPRRPDEPDGPDEMHVVLVDNGRSRVLAGEMAEILYCIRCGACLNACPVYREIGGHAYGSVYPGPVGAVLTPALGGIEAWSDLPQASTLCGACREVCPVRIDIPRMLLALRREADEAGRSPLWAGPGLAAFRLAGAGPGRFHAAVRLAGAATRLLGRGGWLTRLPPPLDGWTKSRDFPPFADKPFSEQLAARRRGNVPPPSRKDGGRATSPLPPGGAGVGDDER